MNNHKFWLLAALILITLIAVSNSAFAQTTDTIYPQIDISNLSMTVYDFPYILTGNVSDNVGVDNVTLALSGTNGLQTGLQANLNLNSNGTSGTWEFELNPNYPNCNLPTANCAWPGEGSVTGTIIAYDLTRNNSSTVLNGMKLDTSPPQIAFTNPSQNNQVFNSNTITFEGTVFDSVSETEVSLVIDGQTFSLGQFSANQTSTWTYNATLADGQHVITAVARDGSSASANESILQKSIRVNPDLTNPTGTFDNPTSSMTVLDHFPIPSLMNGIVQDNVAVEKVEVTITGNNGKFKEAATLNAINAPTEYRWSFEVSPNDLYWPGYGQVVVDVWAFDTSGNYFNIGTKTFEFTELHKPTITVDNLSNGDVIGLPKTVTGTVSDNDSGVQAVKVYQGTRLLGSATINGSNWEFTLDNSNVQQGLSKTFLFAAADNIRIPNIESVMINNIDIDTSPPILNINSVTTSSPNTYEINGRAEDSPSGVDRIEIYKDQTLIATIYSSQIINNEWTAAISTASYSPGSYDITATAYDNIGNGTTANAITINIPQQSNPQPNTNPSTGSITDPSPNATITGATTVRGTAVDNGAGIQRVKIFAFAGAITGNGDTAAITGHNGNTYNWEMDLAPGMSQWPGFGNTVTLAAVVFDKQWNSTTIARNTGITFLPDLGMDVSNLSNNQTIASMPYTIKATAYNQNDDPSGTTTVSVKVDNGNFNAVHTFPNNQSNKSEYYTLSGLYGGKHSVTFKVEDDLTGTEFTKKIDFFLNTARKPQPTNPGRSTDSIAPTITITRPQNRQTLDALPVTVEGIAEDFESGMNRVEINDNSGNLPGFVTGTTLQRQSLSWSYSITQEGDYSLEISAYDNAGNETHETIRFSVQLPQTTPADTTDPVIYIKTAPNQTYTLLNQIQIEGFASDASGINRIIVEDITNQNNPMNLNTITPQTNDWSYSPGNISNGTYTFRFTAYDNAGNSNTAEISFTVSVQQSGQDTTNPTLTVNLQNNESVPENYTLTGTAEDNESGIQSVKLWELSGNAFTYLGQATMNRNAWEFSLNLPEGQHTITVTAYDNSNPNQYLTNHTTRQIDFTVDATRPTVTIDTINNPVTSIPITLTGTASDSSGISEVKIYYIEEDTGDDTIIGDADFDTATGVWTYTIAPGNGTHYYGAVAYDNAGNFKYTQETEVVIDVPGILINNGDEYTKNSNLEVTVSPPASSNVTSIAIKCGMNAYQKTYQIPSSNIITVDVTDPQLHCPAEEGTITLYAAFNGIQSGAVYSDSIHLDLTVPTASISEPSNNATVNTLPFTLKAIIEDPAGNSKVGASGINEVKVRIDGKYAGEMQAGSNNEWTLSIDNTIIDNGQYNIEVLAEDLAGNSVEDSINVTIAVDNPNPNPGPSPGPSPPGGGGGGFFGGGGGIPQQPEQPEAEEPETGSQEEPEQEEQEVPDAVLRRTGNLEENTKVENISPGTETPTAFLGFASPTGFMNLGLGADIGIAIGAIIALSFGIYTGRNYLIRRRERKGLEQ